jgi:enoyl-CoA hydratase
MSSEKLVLSSRSPSNNVVILTLNRPKAKNALSTPLFEDLNAELDKADKDDSIRAIVITGGEKVFAAGADIKEMKDKTCKSVKGVYVTDDSRRGIPKQFPWIMG